MNLENAKKIFFEESAENLQRLEEDLLILEENSHDPEFVNALFREVHTIKGSAGMFGFSEISGFAHVFENMLDLVRKNELAVTPDLVQISLKAHDYLLDLLSLCKTGDPLSDEVTQRGSAVIAQITSQTTVTVPGAGAPAAQPVSVNSPEISDIGGEVDEEIKAAADSGELVDNKYWHISLRFSPSVYKNGLDPFSFISYLKNKGEIINVAMVTAQIPPLEKYDPELCYLGFEIDFEPVGNVERKDILSIFEFIADDCTINVIPPKSTIAHYVDMIHSLPEAPDRLGDLLVASGTLTQFELTKALSVQQTRGEVHTAQPLGDMLVEEKILARPVIEAALEKQREIRGRDDKTRSSIRIEANKIDSLIALVGELVINSANVKELSERSSDQVLVEAVNTMVRLIDEIRDSTMNIRMVPIGDTFGTFRRTVHDLSKELGKEVDLEILGGETELDKTIVEKITDPLMHLVRNVVDHGIESPDERIMQGKSARGTLTLNAFHESGSIVVEVKDDGKGLSRDKIFSKAVEKGLLTPGAIISDADLFMMVTQPGFSTAEKVTNISGRGVGMDVVRKNVESLRGSLDIESQAGVGTTMRVHLPLTLAIIDGFLVKVGGLSYVFPLDMVVECTDIDEDMLRNEGGDFFSLRGEALPYLRVADFFGLEQSDADGQSAERKENMVIVEYAHKRAGLIVDELVGKFQTVIKPLGKLFSKLLWISGATIVGNGDVAMIIDVPRLITRVRGTTLKKEKSA